MKNFFITLGKANVKSLIKLILSYLIPIINIFILYGVKQQFFFSPSIIGVILGANSAFLVAVAFEFFKFNKLNFGILSIGIFGLLGVVPFSINTVETTMEITIIQYLDWYNYSLVLSTVSAVILSLYISYIEVQNEYTRFANAAENEPAVEIEGQDIKL